MNDKAIDFSDLEDSEYWDAVSAGDQEKVESLEERMMKETTGGHTRSVANVARFDCDKCGGSGKIHIYRRGGGWAQTPETRKCWVCKGSGKTKTDPAARAKNRARAKQKRLAAREANLRAAVDFLESRPEVKEWFDRELAKASPWELALSYYEQLQRKGELSEKQIAVVERSIERANQWRKEREDRPADANVAGAAKLIEAFRAARDNGLKFPKLRISGFVFTLAGAASKNAGCLYVKAGGTYLGKITPEGRFFASRDCTDEQKTRLGEIGSDPLKAAQVDGLQTGRCSCCGRELTNQESVELGIGPICRSKWGW